MIKLENTITPSADQWNTILLSMRNPMNSWRKSDSRWEPQFDTAQGPVSGEFVIGPNDHDLMMRLAKAGPERAKYRRMIVVYADVTAPLYWWKVYDTYKVGTVSNSCSTMHKIHSKQFELSDFSHEHLTFASSIALQEVIYNLNYWRVQYDLAYTENRRKECWWQFIQLLPSSYNQRRTIMLNYEVLANIYRQRKGHKLDEWQEFCAWIEQLPYSELITGKEAEENG